MVGRICKGDKCIEVNWLTTTWTVEQVQEVLNLFSQGYSPYKISRIVHRRMVDVYQLIYHREEAKAIIEELTIPKNYVIFNNIRIPVKYISTRWTANEVAEVLNLSEQGYSPYMISRIVHRRMVDVYQIVYHKDYFNDILRQLTEFGNGVLCDSYGQCISEFDLAGNWTTEKLCEMENNNEPIIQWFDEHTKHYWLTVVYKPFGKRSPELVDIFRAVFRFRGEADLFCIDVYHIYGGAFECAGMPISKDEIKEMSIIPDNACLIDQLYHGLLSGASI